MVALLQYHSRQYRLPLADRGALRAYNQPQSVHDGALTAHARKLHIQEDLLASQEKPQQEQKQEPSAKATATPFTGNPSLGDWLPSQLAELLQPGPGPSLFHSLLTGSHCCLGAQRQSPPAPTGTGWVRQRGRGRGPALGGRSGKRDRSAGILEASLMRECRF